MYKKSFFLALICFGSSFFNAHADEGMWLPQLLEAVNEKRMKSLGMKISAKDIYDVNKGSLKDAVLIFGGGCTGEVISEKGLVLTNHHCGYGNIQRLSSIENNYLKDGFWAKNFAEELPNAGLTVTFIVRIDDVSKMALQGVKESMIERERQSVIDKNIDALRKNTKKEEYQDILIRPFYEGNQYYLFIIERFKDVRLVGAPPSSIGNFGKDTDNWMWPRHTGDFSLFRIYANKKNQPAEYSPENIPYKPKRSLAVNLGGIKEGDFTMVFGFPGRTTQYLPSEAVRQIVEVNDPAKILVRGKVLDVMDKYMRADEAIKIQYASKYAGVANAWKKWQGEVLGLAKTHAVEKKKAYEKIFLQRMSTSEVVKAKYGNVLQELNQNYKLLEPFGLARDYFLESTSRVELFSIINKIISLMNAKASRQDAAYNKNLSEQISSLTGLYKDLNTKVDRDLFAAMMQLYTENQDAKFVSEMAKAQKAQYGNDYKKWADAIYDDNFLLNGEQILNQLKSNPDEIYNRILGNESFRLLNSMATHYNENVTPGLNTYQPRIDNLQRKYMQAQMDIMKDRKFYPDANSTMRVTYGQVSGYKPADGKTYGQQTYLEGVMEKYVPGDYEFDLPKKLIELYQNKDYGIYGITGKNGEKKMPVCFVASNHTTGGNSGSPALDAYGNLIGLNFDRVWEGTMSDINYDPSICRNIMVDARYILFIIDKFAGARHLVNEIKIVGLKKQ